MKVHTRYVFLLSLLSAPLLSATALAADVPSTAEPSRAPSQIAPLPAPQQQSRGGTSAAPAAATEAPPGAEQVQFALSVVNIEGMTVYRPEEIVPLYHRLPGTFVSLAAIYQLAERLTAKYRNDGYILSQVIVPPQTIENGQVTLRVVEGYVDSVIVRSEDDKDAEELKSYAAAIMAARPLRAQLLEKALLLINDQPGISAKSVLSPSPTQTGAADLILTIEHKRYDLTVGADNRGSQYMGPLQLNTGLRLNNLIGRRNSINLQFFTAPSGQPHRELDYASLGMTQLLGYNGASITVNGSLTKTEPGYLLKPLEVFGASHTYNVELTRPFVRSRDRNLSTTVKFMYLDTSRGDNLGLGNTEDRIRVLRFGSTYQFPDWYGGADTLAVEFSQGLDLFHTKPKGSPNMTRAEGDPEFFKVTAEASRVQGLTEHFDIFTSVTGQWAADTLLASEEFGVGGTAYGSAYNSSEITGQKGLAGRVELRSNNPFAMGFRAWQGYGFYDVGQVWDPKNATVKDRIRSLASTGLGLRAMLNDTFSGSAELALPLTRPVETENSNDPRFFGAFSARF